ncbi:DUF89 domain-containing protein [Elusimicrobiota bacterium]
MKIYLDCIPCFVRQALECAKISSDDTELRKEVLNNVMQILIELNYDFSPPDVARDIYSKIKEITGIADPYEKIRDQDNRKMLEFYDSIASSILEYENALFLSCKLAAGGNIIDSGVGKKRDMHTENDLERILRILPAVNDFSDLVDELRRTKTLLYLGDNAGEIVMDKLFINAIKRDFPLIKVYYAVRGGAVINDVTIKDARQVALDEVCEIIDNGDCSPGTNLSLCSDEFNDIFNDADMIIAKGQGNFETLSYIKDKNLFFLLLVKCSVIARHLGVEAGSMIIKKANK